MEEYRCNRKLHLWGTQDEAARCCNGWIRLWAPMCYGETQIGLRTVSREDWYKPGRMWRTVLVREEDTAEIERLLTLCPLGLLSSTRDNPGLTVPQ